MSAPAHRVCGRRRRRQIGLRAFLRLVAIEHSVFALPFAYLAALTAMHSARGRVNWADLLPHHGRHGRRPHLRHGRQPVIDRHIDARNPRTAQRELVTGAVSVRTAWTGAAVALGVFLVAAAALNPLCLALAPLALVPLVVYPYAKRFTDWPHAMLALAQLVGPVGAWLGVTGTFAGSGPAWVLGVAVGLWIGGFDLIYACQDAEVDRAIGVRSVPARYGVRVRAARCRPPSHVVTFALFVWFGALVGLGWLWWIGLALAAAAFVYEHAIVAADRPVPGEPRLLHRQRLRRHRAVRVRAGWTWWYGLGLRPLSGYGRCHAHAVDRRRLRRLRHAVRRRRAARAARRRLRGGPRGVAGGPADHPGRDRPPVPGRALEGRPRRLAGSAATSPRPTSPTGRPATSRPGPSSGSYPARGMVVVPASTAACAGHRDRAVQGPAAAGGRGQPQGAPPGRGRAPGDAGDPQPPRAPDRAARRGGGGAAGEPGLLRRRARARARSSWSTSSPARCSTSLGVPHTLFTPLDRRSSASH